MDSIKPSEISLWSGVQLLAVLLGASNLPVWAHHPSPRTCLALHEWLVVQIVASAMLFPLLASNRLTLLANTLIALAFAEMAGLLANQSQAAILMVWIYASIWQIGLCGISWHLDHRTELGAVCLITFYAIGGVGVAYLHSETMLINGGSNNVQSPMGPIMSGLADIHHIGWSGWLQVAIPFILSMIWPYAKGRNPA